MDEKLIGYYKHYKGGLYEACGFALLESDKTEMVIYRPANNSDNVYVRPWKEFQEKFEYVTE